MKSLTRNLISAHSVRLSRALLSLALATLAITIVPTTAMAREPVYLGLGGKVSLSNWKGNNNNNTSENNNSYQADATQLGANISIAYKNFYGGLSLQGGEFDFKKGSPAQIYENGQTVLADSNKVSRSEFNLVAGYYFWPKISLFLDLKTVGYEWAQSDYSRSSYGLGFGVAGFIPLSPKWSLYGSTGLIPLKVAAEGKNIGDGTGAALTFGAQYKITNHGHISFNSNFQHHQYTFDNEQKQAYTIGSIEFAYNYYFQL